MNLVSDLRSLTKSIRKRLILKSGVVRLDRIGYLQYPELWLVHGRSSRKRTTFLPGDWDTIVQERVFWSAVYEPVPAAAGGMIPLSRYEFYASLQDRFLNGFAWRDTGWYQWVQERPPDRRVRRYETKALLEERLGMIDRLFEDFQSHRFVDHPNRPLINIGRNGQLAIEDGRHRVCLASVAGVQELRVDVSFIHDSLRPSLIRRLDGSLRQDRLIRSLVCEGSRRSRPKSAPRA